MTAIGLSKPWMFSFMVSCCPLLAGNGNTPESAGFYEVGEKMEAFAGILLHCQAHLLHTVNTVLIHDTLRFYTGHIATLPKLAYQNKKKKENIHPRI